MYNQIVNIHLCFDVITTLIWLAEYFVQSLLSMFIYIRECTWKLSELIAIKVNLSI